MNSFVWTIAESWIVATAWRQLCSSLLHNWQLARDSEAGWQSSPHFFTSRRLLENRHTLSRRLKPSSAKWS
jgi:hypothetical protein